MSPLLALIIAHAIAAEPPGLLVSDIKYRGDKVPTGKVRIWGYRNGRWNVSPETDAALVEWDRLLDNDRIEVVS